MYFVLWQIPGNQNNNQIVWNLIVQFDIVFLHGENEWSQTSYCSKRQNFF